jgi:hypothetical protein
VIRLRSKLTYANVMATIAVFIALGGASYAAVKVPKNSVGTKQIKNGAITGAKIKSGAVTGAKIAAGGITGADINLSTLGPVPSAGHAATADQASSAARANVAGSVETLPAPEPLHIASLQNGCLSNNENLGPAAYYKDGFGQVHLVGYFACPSEGVDAFILPPGFRPSTEILQRETGTKAEAEILVLPTGVVRAFDSLTGTLFGVEFRTN